MRYSRKYDLVYSSVWPENTWKLTPTLFSFKFVSTKLAFPFFLCLLCSLSLYFLDLTVHLPLGFPLYITKYLSLLCLNRLNFKSLVFSKGLRLSIHFTELFIIPKSPFFILKCCQYVFLNVPVCQIPILLASWETITCFQSPDDYSLILEIQLIHLFVEILLITIGIKL